jgi:hypothetical protein
MKRVLGCALGLAGMLSSTEAWAKKNSFEPWMWGIGPSIGTVVVPGHFPLALPTKINNYDFIDEGPRAGDENSDDPKRDLLNGDPRFTSIERVRDDVRLGFDGFYGIDKDNRVGAGVGTAFGTGYSDVFFTLNYDRVIVSENPFNVVVGGGAGFGSMRFKGTNEEIKGFENELLRLPYFPLKVRLQGQLRNGGSMFGLGIFGQTAVPSNTFYTDLDGNDQSIESPLNLFLYLSAGLEFTVQFGDFTAPKKNAGGKKGGKQGGAKGGGGGGGGKGGGGKKEPVKHP